MFYRAFLSSDISDRFLLIDLMEGNTNRKPNEQGGHSLANNANDWRSHHDPDLRKRVISKM